MKKIYTFILLFFSCLSVYSQQPGDTIRVQAWEFGSLSRDSVVVFPDNDNLTYEKILLKYTMRCKEGLVSNTTERNLGCGEWDFSNNTYLVDSNHVETLPSLIGSHYITNYEELVFPFISTPVYDLMRGTQTNVEITNTSNEIEGAIQNGSEGLGNTLNTASNASRSQFLYLAGELTAGGLTAGEIASLSLDLGDEVGEANFLKIRMKNSAEPELVGVQEFNPSDEVYYNDQELIANSTNRFNFHTPFVWDGMSNIIVEYSFTNTDGDLVETSVLGSSTSETLGLSGSNGNNLVFENNAYIECNDYPGFEGTTNRTIEAWVKTDNGGNGEIMTWGRAITGQKFTFRFTSGRLRVEVHGGGTEGSTQIDDGEWHHVVCVLAGSNVGNIRFYIDGQLDPLQTVGNTAISSNISTGFLRVNRGLNNRYFDAEIDEVRLWSTDISQELLNEWKGLKVDESHPHYENLELYFEFNGEGNDVIDSSPNGRNATLFGDRFTLSEVGSDELFKSFEVTKNRPNSTFYQGDYQTSTTMVEVDRPIAKNTRHLVLERSIEETDPNFALDDNVISNDIVELWTPEQTVFNETTGALIETIQLTPEGEITIQDLEYDRRFPYMNELVSFVTPYGIGLDFGIEGQTWYMDMSDYEPILKGNKRMVMTLGGQRQEQMDLEFLFIVGTPPRDVVQYEQVWQATSRIGIASIADVMDDTKFAPTQLPLSSDAETFKLKSSITGHGVEGEFQANGGIVNHIIDINGLPTFLWNLNKECAFNAIFPQGGTWVFDRQGWCPGERSTLTEEDITNFVTPGEMLEIDYTTSAPLIPTGDYRYHVAHQIVGYGPANFDRDASIVQIMAPNNLPEFRRVGTICANPMVTIRNTGGNDLTSLTIRYWINDSQAPQTFEWTGNLAFMEEEVVTIPSPAELWFDLQSENNKFYAEVVSPNGGSDQYEFNNMMVSNFEFPEILPSNISVDVRTNNFANENSYQLVSADGEVIGANDLVIPNTSTSDDYELQGDCFTLKVFDSGHDGLTFFANTAQGSGSILIRDGSGNVIRTFNSDFGGGFDFRFSTSFPVSSEDLEFLRSVKVFPNPAQSVYSLAGEEIGDAQFFMTNQMGQQVQVKTNSRSNDLVTFDINHLQSGIYYIIIQKDEVRTTRKLVVNK